MGRMIFSEGDLVDGKLTGRILDCALEVHKVVGPGLLESAYRYCLAGEMRDQGLHFEEEVEVPLRYKGRSVPGVFRADIVVENAVIVELKTVERLLPVHGAQLLTYLKLSGLRVGLLINFNTVLLKHGIRRLVC